jgi:hypothetical protein
MLFCISFISAVCHRCISVRAAVQKSLMRVLQKQLLPHFALKLYFEKSYNNRWLIAIEQGHTHTNHVCEFILLIYWTGSCIKINKIFVYEKDKGFC